MQMAIEVAGFTPGEADQLRQAMGSKRSRERMERMRARLYDGMAERGIIGERRRPDLRQARGLRQLRLPREPLGVASPTWCTPVRGSSGTTRPRSARRCSTRNPWGSTRRTRWCRTPAATVSRSARPISTRRRPRPTLEWSTRSSSRVRSSDGAAQPGDTAARGAARHRLGARHGRRSGRAHRSPSAARGPVRDHGRPQAARVPSLKLDALEALATAGAFGCFADETARPLDRRRALWSAGAVAQTGSDRLPGVVTGVEAPDVAGDDRPRGGRIADLWATGVAPDGHPTRFVRPHLDALGVVPALGPARRRRREPRCWSAGVVTHRQRPATAAGTTFINLEDETGLINVMCSRGCWIRYRRVARGAPRC